MAANSYEKPDFWSKKAFSEGYPARSVYKLKELDEKFGLLKKNSSVLDLGAAPGSWTVFALRTLNGTGHLTSIDLTPLAGAPITRLSSTFRDCSKLTSIDLTPFAGISITTNWDNAFSGCLSLKTIIAPWLTALSVHQNTFGSNTSTYTGRNTYSTGKNKLYVPTGATGYDSSYWLDPLCNADKCGFTLSATL